MKRARMIALRFTARLPLWWQRQREDLIQTALLELVKCGNIRREGSIEKEWVAYIEIRILNALRMAVRRRHWKNGQMYDNSLQMKSIMQRPELEEICGALPCVEPRVENDTEERLMLQQEVSRVISAINDLPENQRECVSAYIEFCINGGVRWYETAGRSCSSGYFLLNKGLTAVRQQLATA